MKTVAPQVRANDKRHGTTVDLRRHRQSHKHKAKSAMNCSYKRSTGADYS